MRPNLLLFIAILFCGILKAQTVEQYVNKGLVLDSMGKYQEAIQSFSKAIELEPMLAVAWYNRGVSKLNASKYSESIVDFNKCIFIDTAMYEAYYNRSIAYKMTNNYQFAWADINKYLTKYPKDVDAVLSRLSLGEEMGEDLYIEKDLHFLLTLDSQNRNLWIKLGSFYNASQQYEKALPIYHKMIQSEPEYSNWFLLRAFTYYYKGAFKESMEDVNIYLVQNPKDPEALKLKADLYFYTNDFNAAALIYEQFLVTDSTNGSLLADYGHCLLQMKRYAESEQILTKAIRNKSEALGYALLGRGLARYHLNNIEEACNDWQKASLFGSEKAQQYIKMVCFEQNNKK